jgi:16S rRNA (uracil1498-N3)-methyltransferase
MPPKPRLFVDHPLSEGQTVPLTDGQAHYLGNVMRLSGGAVVALFNGRDGEWDGAIAALGKRGGMVTPVAQTRPQVMPPDLWLLFAPVKKARTDFIVEKAVELGVGRIMPVQTDFTNAERLRPDKMRAHAMEAAEQCGAVFVPPVDDTARLTAVLDRWPDGRDLWFCDETLAAGEQGAGRGTGSGAGAVLIGPEGGFSPMERARLRALPFARPIRLGPRILRADTAAVAALVLWQTARGDW